MQCITYQQATLLGRLEQFWSCGNAYHPRHGICKPYGDQPLKRWGLSHDLQGWDQQKPEVQSWPVNVDPKVRLVECLLVKIYLPKHGIQVLLDSMTVTIFKSSRKPMDLEVSCNCSESRSSVFNLMVFDIKWYYGGCNVRSSRNKLGSISSIMGCAHEHNAKLSTVGGRGTVFLCEPYSEPSAEL